MAAAVIAGLLSACTSVPIAPFGQLQLASDESAAAKAQPAPERPLITDPHLRPRALTPAQRELLADRAQLFQRIDNMWTSPEHETIKKSLDDELNREIKAFGLDSPYSVATLYQLGKYARLIHDNEQSVRWFNDVLRIREKYLGSGAIDTADALHEILRGLVSLGKLDEAQRLVDDYVSKARRAAANETAQTYFNYDQAFVYKARGQYHLAINILQRCADFKIANPVVQRRPPTLLFILNDLAYCQIEVGQLQAPLHNLELWVATRCDKPQAEDVDATRMLVSLAEQFKNNHLDSRSLRAATAALQILDNKNRLGTADVVTFRGRLWHLGEKPAAAPPAH